MSAPDPTPLSNGHDIRGGRAPSPRPAHRAWRRGDEGSSLIDTLTGLSATVTRLHGLYERSEDDPALRVRLLGITYGLEQLIHDLLQAGEDRTDDAPPEPGRSSPATAPRPEAPLATRTPEDTFVAWLLGAEKADELELHGSDGMNTPISWVLGSLTVSAEPLPASAAAELGLAGGTTMGTAATELILAVSDPAGPRCRSYRAAAAYLQDRKPSRNPPRSG
jgi:hypothetical protein